jgi:hypothetical protein
LLAAHIDPGSGAVDVSFTGVLQSNPTLDPSNWVITFNGWTWTVITAAASGSGVSIVCTQTSPTAEPDRITYTAASPDLRDAAGALVGPQGPVVLYNV